MVAGYPAVSPESYRDLARELGIDEAVSWDLRFIPEREVAPILRRAAVIALPYTDVDQSAVLLTALAFGKPIVASRLGGFPETIEDGVHGFLVEPGDPQALADALERILVDRARAQEMSAAVERLARTTLSWPEIGKATMAVYQEAIAAHGGES